MRYFYHVKRTTKYTLVIFAISLILLSFIGAYIGVHGNRVTYSGIPHQKYEEVTFASQARDNLQLGGWYLPASGNKTAVIVHGWGGNRARLLNLAEYLQRRGINVLTFDLRGGTGKNSYGQYEAGDVAGAVSWLAIAKHTPADHVSLIGVSMGGAAVVVYAADHPIGTVVLLSPVVDIGEAKRLVLKNYHFLWPQLYAAGSSQVERVVWGIRPVNPRDVFAQIESPILIMHGTADQLTSVKTIYRVESAMHQRGQSNTTFIYLPDEGHKFIDADSSLGHIYANQIASFISR